MLVLKYFSFLFFCVVVRIIIGVYYYAVGYWLHDGTLVRYIGTALGFMTSYNIL